MEKFQKEQGRPIEDQEKSREAKELFKREKRFAYTQAILNWTERLSSVEIPGLAELLPSRKRGAAFLPAMLFTLAMGCNEWQESKPAVPGGKLIETSCGIDDREYIESSRDWIADNPELIQREMDLFWPDAVATARGLSETVQKARIICGFEEEDTALGAEAPEFSIAGLVGDMFPDARIVNQGVVGSKTRELISRLEGLSEQFDLIMIHTGGNDIVRFTNFDDLKTDIKTVLTLAKTRADHVTLTTSGNIGTSKLLPLGTRWLFERRTRKVRDIFKPAAEEVGVDYIDLFRERDKDPFAKDPRKYYAADIFHPSDDGYAEWFSIISKTLEQIDL